MWHSERWRAVGQNRQNHRISHLKLESGARQEAAEKEGGKMPIG